MSKIIYADNAATTKLDAESLALMTDLQRVLFANPSSAYKLARRSKEILRSSREKIARAINAEPGEIIFTSGGTESDNWAIKSTVLSTLRERPNVITSAIEHKAVLNSCAAMERLGCSVTRLPVDGNGLVNPDDLRARIIPSTRLVTVMLANNEVGTIQPIETLATVAHSSGKIFHTDGVQAVGHIPVDVRALGVDMLSASGHKFNGPKGVGFLYVRAGLELSSYLDGGGQEFSRRAGTENVPAIAAMALALEKNCRDMRRNMERQSTTVAALIERLRVTGVDFILNGGANRLPGHVSISFRACEGEMLMHRLDLKNICVSTGSACNSGRAEVSHVLQAMSVSDDYIGGTIRVTFGKENSPDEAEEIGRSIVDIIGSSTS